MVHVFFEEIINATSRAPRARMMCHQAAFFLFFFGSETHLGRAVSSLESQAVPTFLLCVCHKYPCMVIVGKHTIAGS